MNARVSCWTRFDITETGLRGNYSRNRMPLTDAANQRITDEAAWHRSRNQQRNWDTFTQLIALRTLPTEITRPRRETTSQGPLWRFEFEIDHASALAADLDDLGALKSDCQGIPMIQGLDESPDTGAVIAIGVNTGFDLQR